MASGDGAANGIPDYTWASDRRAHARITFMIANAVASMQPTGAIAQQLSQAASPRLIAIETME
jgi:hypothetical protein